MKEINICIDIDECSTTLHNCSTSEICVNMNGTFDCPCRSGYERINERCTDIDECEKAICDSNALCHNTVGSFTCECNKDFDGDGFHCEQSKKCRSELGCEGYQQQCVWSNKNVSMECGCSSGFRMSQSSNKFQYSHDSK